jgi:hypothetical protein
VRGVGWGGGAGEGFQGQAAFDLGYERVGRADDAGGVDAQDALVEGPVVQFAVFRRGRQERGMWSDIFLPTIFLPAPPTPSGANRTAGERGRARNADQR